MFNNIIENKDLVNHEKDLCYGAFINSIRCIYYKNEYIFSGSMRSSIYRPGDIISEYIRFAPVEDVLVDIIKNCRSFYEPLHSYSVGNILDEAKRIVEKLFGYTVSEIVSLIFVNKIKKLCESDYVYSYDFLKRNTSKDNITYLKDIFVGNTRGDQEIECCGQLLLLAYLYSKKNEFHILKITTMQYSAFLKNHILGVLGEEDFDEALEWCTDVNNLNVHVELTRVGQMFVNKLYFTDAMEFLEFDYINAYSNGVSFKQCANCGLYFPVYGRSDTIYCDFPLIVYKNKTCKEIGAQKAWLNKEKNDEVTGRYRKIYMRLKMRAKRHPYDKEIEKLVGKLIDEGKIMRKKYEQGAITLEEFMEWLNKFDDFK